MARKCFLLAIYFSLLQLLKRQLRWLEMSRHGFKQVWSFVGVDPGLSEKGFKQPSTYVIWLLLLFNKSFLHKKKYGQNICVWFTLGGSTEPPLDPPQLSSSYQVNFRESSYSAPTFNFIFDTGLLFCCCFFSCSLSGIKRAAVTNKR